ncbi:four helix bundle protein [Candidatus Roizmanbacteria bacterium CG_4_10_14_0_2_um_filter_39_13]|uniref:Four helix bundle protein n=1 Tax=Candidatus Roizmanbacteria bacterium CG_4_10_14_0_2_um_filter_39_13 TaxID=1974825 RepID=A0A2M7TWU1_9BACT|nr:MAG: four helix bundle protein [Candidatus Roizmanbacteria bacterium CG_4_10_14_0_2_um_filter_39_13]
MSNNKYDLIERTSLFGEQIILFVKKISDTTTSKPIKNQLVQSGTSIGANYMEADGAESGRDFNHKLSICKKEAKETMYWLRMVATVEPKQRNECRTLYQEAKELTLIFSSILLKRKKKSTI